MANKADKRTQAREAWEAGDLEASLRVHTNAPTVAREDNQAHKKSFRLKKFLQGGLEGSMFIYMLVSAGLGLGLTSRVIFALGLSLLSGIGICFKIGNFLEKKNEYEYTVAEMKRETWEYENFPDGEMSEMVEIYQKKGLSQKDATDLVNVLSRDKNNFIDTMMVEELGMLPPDVSQTHGQNNFIAFLGFMTVGPLPLAFKLFLEVNQINLQMVVSCGGLIFFLAAFSNPWVNKKWWNHGLVVSALSTAAALLTHETSSWVSAQS